MHSEGPQRPWSSLYGGVWALSVGVLLLEVSLTRVLSAVTWYHFAFLVISAVLFGFGASGLFVYLLPRRRSERALRWVLGLSGLGFVGSVYLMLSRLAYLRPMVVTLGVGEMVRMLAVVYVAVAAPFFFGGALALIAAVLMAVVPLKPMTRVGSI